jgi:hypothetical protein
MGRAFSMLAMGPLGAVVALTAVVEFLKRGIDDANKKLDEMAATASKTFGGGDWITDYVAAMSQAAAETENLAEALKKASDAGPEIKNRYDAETKAIQASVDALKTKLKAEEDLDVVAARKNGATPDEIDALRARYEAQNQAAQDAADRMMQQARQRELAERQGNKDALDAAAQSKTTPTDVIMRRKNRADELAAQEATLAKATSEMNTEANDNLKERLEYNKKLLEDSRKRYGDSDPLGGMKELQAEIDKLESETAEARAAAAKSKILELGKQALKDQQDATQEKSALEEATKAAADNRTRIVELQKQIAEANTAAKIKAESTSQLLAGLAGFGDAKTFEKAAGVDTEAGMSDFTKKFAEAQQRLQSHRGTQADQQTVILMNRLLAVTQQSDQQLYTLLERVMQDLIQHKNTTQDRIEQLWMRLERVGQ